MRRSREELVYADGCDHKEGELVRERGGVAGRTRTAITLGTACMAMEGFIASLTARMTRVSGAILLFVAGVSIFGVMDGLGKLLATDFPLLQLVWARSAFAVPVLLATTAPAGWLSLLRCERPLLQ